MTVQSIDKTLVKNRFTRSMTTYDHEAVAQQQIARTMAARVPTACARLLEIGAGTGFYTRLVLDRCRYDTYYINDLCESMQPLYEGLKVPNLIPLMGDAESLALPRELDLITSCSTFQWFLSPQRILAKCYEALLPQGVLAFSTFGPQNLCEIKQLTGAGLTYNSLARWQQLLQQAGFEVDYIEEQTLELGFDSPQAVLNHMRQTGVTGTAAQRWTKRTLSEFQNQYTQLFNVSGRVRLTYNPIYIIAKKP